MVKKLFVGNLDWSTTNDSLRRAFEAFGPVTEATVIMDRYTGRSRGFGFVTLASGGADAIRDMNGQWLDGRRVRVDEAHERRPRRNNNRQDTYHSDRGRTGRSDNRQTWGGRSRWDDNRQTWGRSNNDREQW